MMPGMYYVGAVLVLIVLVYVGVNIVRYPWHALVFLAAVVGLGLATGAGARVKARLNASQNPAAQRLVSGWAALNAIVKGDPPYNEARWWLPRTLVQLAYWAVMLAMVLAVLVALGGVFVWLDKALATR